MNYDQHQVTSAPGLLLPRIVYCQFEAAVKDILKQDHHVPAAVMATMETFRPE